MITIIQLVFFIKLNSLNENSEKISKIPNDSTGYTRKKLISLKELDEELSNKDIKVISQEKDGDNWRCIVLLEGTCEDIIDILKNFKNYNIINYNIEGNSEKYLVNLEMLR